MKKLLLILLLLANFLGAIAQNVIAPPNPPRLVNDLAGVLSKEQVAILEEKLVALDDSTSNQIAVVILKTLEGYDVQDYANKLFRSWGIGNKKTNNGVLILASIEDRKVWIEVGYGLEGAIPDITASSIYRNEIVPEFKQQNYFRGIDNAINALSKAAVGEYKTKRNKPSSDGKSGNSILTFLFIVVVVIFVLGAGGRGGGGRGGGMMSRRGAANVAEALLWSSLLGGNNRGGGGFGGGGGGFGGGGFGGFGGGSSGGGGAGGSW
ncbi:YgcG family protein [Sediminibacterium sp.]|uniref:TPM domain-containing protein n=1 Tax=Sediminibacterium sp. TaxID=1917865 RepID=UPI0025FFB7F8|nr:TPM domain-containing protein [Sediminibacterium sp.]MBT9483911.1 TPM domain-containing protein [Sediminibacterium sp.]